MLTKQQALKLRNALLVANKGSTKILSAITASKSGKITASAHKQYSKELRLIKSIAAKSERHLLKAFSNTQDLVKASKIEAVEKLLVASAELSLRAKLMSQVLADADELSELPDGPADFDADETEEIVESDDDTEEVEADDEEIECDDETDEVEADDDEEIVEADDDEEIIESDDEEIVESDDEEAETPVEAKRKALARAKALKARKAVKAKRVIPTRKRISANAKMVRSASVKRTSLAQANKSLIGWDFGVK